MPRAGEPAEPSHLAVGHVTKAHGTKGEVFVWPLTDEPDDVFAQGRSLLLGTADGELGDAPEPVEIHHVRPFKRGLLVSFAGRFDRNAVEPFAGRYLFADRDTLAPPGPDELWYHQLVGLGVRTAAGDHVGRVREVYETEPAHLIEVEAEDGRLILIPATRRIIVRVDEAAGLLVVDPPEGLLEL